MAQTDTPPPTRFLILFITGIAVTMLMMCSRLFPSSILLIACLAAASIIGFACLIVCVLELFGKGEVLVPMEWLGANQLATMARLCMAMMVLAAALKFIVSTLDWILQN